MGLGGPLQVAQSQEGKMGGGAAGRLRKRFNRCIRLCTLRPLPMQVAKEGEDCAIAILAQITMPPFKVYIDCQGTLQMEACGLCGQPRQSTPLVQVLHGLLR